MGPRQQKRTAMRRSRQQSRHQREYEQARVAPQFRRISEFVEPSVKKICENFGFPEIRIVQDWRWIAGADLADRCYPVRIQKRRDVRVLVVCAHSVYATEVAHQTHTLLDRIATACGYRAVDLIRVTQLGDAMLDSPSEPRRVSQRKPDSPSASALETVANVQNPEMREALTRLASSIQSKAASADRNSPSVQEPPL